MKENIVKVNIAFFVVPGYPWNKFLPRNGVSLNLTLHIVIKTGQSILERND